MWTGGTTPHRGSRREQEHTGIMTANQRRPGFRLPWSSEADDPSGDADREKQTGAPPADAGASEAGESNGAAPEAESPAPTEPVAGAVDESSAATTAATEATAEATTGATADAPAEPPADFLRDLIAAMRRVADDARHAGVAELKSRAEEDVRTLEADAEKRRQELRERADADINGVGEWARAEAERIKAEAEQRVAARRSQLEQQLAAVTTRTDVETKALRARVEEYERELDAYYAQLSEINDPAAFAAAAKRMPSAPKLKPQAGAPAASSDGPVDALAPATPAEGTAMAAATGGAAPETASEEAAPEVHPAEEEVLAARLAELDEKLEPEPAAEAAHAEPGGPATTDIVVKGLGSFGAITGFRQSLAGQEGISGVALSLGQTGEFVFRATHAAGFNVADAITAVEGEGAKIEQRPEGGLRVTLERSR
jgi:hypothetical protein